MFSKPERLAEYHCLDVLRITALHSFVPEDTYVFHIIRQFRLCTNSTCYSLSASAEVLVTILDVYYH